ncbi:MAG: type II toxin-antitoxin system prevent-host-death family antitoxin [Dehalococcoidia bacterium]
MVTVGVRELRANLSYWLKQVKGGELVVVTERGWPVARLEPVDIKASIKRLRAAGVTITPPTEPAQQLSPEDLIPVSGNVSDLIVEDRG